MIGDQFTEFDNYTTFKNFSLANTGIQLTFDVKIDQQSNFSSPFFHTVGNIKSVNEQKISLSAPAFC